MTVFMPLATPVWWAGTACDDQVAERREREADADAEQRRRRSAGRRDGCARPRAARSDAVVNAVPASSAAARAEARARCARRRGPGSSSRSSSGSRYRPETTTEAPNPKPVLLGSCANCGKTMNDAYMPAPSRNAARLVVHTPRIRIIVMSISGLRLRISTAIQAHRDGDADGEQAERLRRAPAPRRGLADREQHDRHADRHQRRGEPVDARRAAHRRLRDESPRRERGEHRRRSAAARTASGS